MKNGNKAEHWVRSTVCFQKVGDDWRIAHDHVSVPADLVSGSALLDLAPDGSSGL